MAKTGMWGSSVMLLADAMGDFVETFREAVKLL
jgi:hypothetical protein